MSAHVQGKVASTTTGTTLAITLDSTPITGNLVTLEILYFSGGASGTNISSIVDGNSNAYTVTPLSPSVYDSLAGQIFQAYLLSAPANAHATITITFANTISAAAVWAEEFDPDSGKVFSFDTSAEAEATANPGSAGVVDTPVITPTNSASLCVAGCAINGIISAANSPWTGATGAITFGCYAEYDLSVTGAQAVAWQADPRASWSTMAMAFSELNVAAPSLMGAICM